MVIHGFVVTNLFADFRDTHRVGLSEVTGEPVSHLFCIVSGHPDSEAGRRVGLLQITDGKEQILRCAGKGFGKLQSVVPKGYVDEVAGVCNFDLRFSGIGFGGGRQQGMGDDDPRTEKFFERIV